MKKNIPIPLIIAGVLFFIFKDLFFKSEPKKSNFIFPTAKEISGTYNQNSIQNIDTGVILNNLCNRDISDKGIQIINFVPCSWKEDIAIEKKMDAASSYSLLDNNGKGVIEMTLKMSELPYTVSPQQRDAFFNIESIKEAAKAVNAISYQKGSLSGLDCHEIIFKKDNLAEAPEGTSYSIHFETLSKTKYIMLAYSVAYMDSVESRKVFYQYLPVFKALSQKFKISN